MQQPRHQNRNGIETDGSTCRNCTRLFSRKNVTHTRIVYPATFVFSLLADFLQTSSPCTTSYFACLNLLSQLFFKFFSCTFLFYFSLYFPTSIRLLIFLGSSSLILPFPPIYPPLIFSPILPYNSFFFYTILPFFFSSTFRPSILFLLLYLLSFKIINKRFRGFFQTTHAIAAIQPHTQPLQFSILLVRDCGISLTLLHGAES